MNIYNVIILDESGSMSAIYNQALTGINEVLSGIRKNAADFSDQHHYVTIVTFEGSGIQGIKTRRDRVAIEKIEDFTRKDYRPGGCTPLYDAMGTYVDITGRRPTYEYALIRGVNDTDEELDHLVEFCRGNLAHVNLIQLNEVPGSKFQPSSEARAGEFVRRLGQVGVEATVRQSRGADIDAACGQLRQRVERRSS